MVQRATVLVVVALCVVGLGFAAASLATDTEPEQGSGNGTGPEQVSEGVESEGTNIGSGSTDMPFFSVLFPVVLVLMVLSIAATVYFDRTAALVVGVVVVALIALMLAGGSAIDLDGSGLPSSNESVLYPGQAENNSTGGAQDAPSDSTDFPIALFGAVGVVVLLGFGAVVYASRSVDDATEALEDDDVGRDPDPDDVADAAGRAADIIEGESGADLSNAVYEAFHEMTDAVDVTNPEAATPREFATAAVTAGADPDPVDELTEVFEAVRYDDEDAEPYEDQAVTALRRIEDGLSGVDADEAATGGGEL
jgi:hypothetical protein